MAAGIPLLAAAIALPLLLTRGGGGPNVKPTLTPLVDSLQHIDPATNRLVATLPQGPHGSGSLATSRYALWVAPRESTVLRIDPRSGRTTATISTGEESSPGPGVANLVYDGRRLVWAATFGVLIPINPVKGTLIAVGAFTAGAELGTSNNVVAVDATSAVVNAWVDYRSHEGNLLHYSVSDNGTPFSAGAGTPMAMAIGFESLWISEFNPATLVRVGANQGSPVLATIDLPFDPVPGGLAAGGGSIWISNAAGDRLARIDPAKHRIVQTIRVGRYPTAVTWGLGSVWVANNEDGTVSRVDPRGGRVVATIPVGPHPTGIAVGAGGVWVAVHPA